MSSLGNQNQLQLSLAPLGELLKAVRLISNFNGFNSPSYPFGQKFMQKKGSPSKSPIWKEKILSDFSSFLISCMICGVVWVSLILMLCLFVCFFFFSKKNGKIRKIQKQCVFVHTGTCVPWMAIETRFLNLVSLVT